MKTQRKKEINKVIMMEKANNKQYIKSVKCKFYKSDRYSANFFYKQIANI